MLKSLRIFTKNELIRGSMILFVMIGIFNLFNYIFQISMARMLGPADYGILATLMSIVYIFGIPQEAIQTVITRYISKFNVKKEYGKMKDIFYRSFKKGVLFSLIFFFIFAIISILLSPLLKIEFWLLIITGLLIFYIFSTSIVRGVLQGKKRFMMLGINLVLESIIKVIFSVLFVFFGLKVYGAMGGVLIAGFIAFIFAFICIKDILSGKRKRGEYKDVYNYNLPILVGVGSIALVYSLDIILARIFFSPELAGKYSFVSLIGKVVLFSSFAIGKAMFPITAEKFESGKKTSGLLKKSLILVFIISVVLLAFCFLIPKEVLRIISLGSTQYLDASNILFIVCLAFSLTAFTNIIVLYSLSTNRIRKFSFLLLIFAVIEIILLSIYNSNLFEFSLSLLVVNIAMFLYSLFLICIKK